METEIVTKLRTELTQEIVSERQVVYIMVQIRKLLELTKEKSNYKSVVFAADWLAHPGLGGNEVARRIVGVFTEWQAENDAITTNGPPQYANMELLKKLDDVISFSHFRSELTQLLERYQLDSQFCKDYYRWGAFLRQYVAVVHDCPLSDAGQQLVDEVTLRVVGRDDLSFQIEWQWISTTTGKQYSEYASI